MITKNTFHAMIVPIIAPTCRYIARPLNTCDSPQATAAKNAIITPASELFALEAGALAQLVVEDPAADEQRDARSPIACHGVMSATLRSIM